MKEPRSSPLFFSAQFLAPVKRSPTRAAFYGSGPACVTRECDPASRSDAAHRCFDCFLFSAAIGQGRFEILFASMGPRSARTRMQKSPGLSNLNTLRR